MAKNTKLQNNTEEFIESVVEKILQKQAAQEGQVTCYPIVSPEAKLLEDNFRNRVVAEGKRVVAEESVGCAAKKASPVDDSLMNLEENIHHTYKLVQELVKKLEPVTFVVPTECQTQENDPQHTIPLCATIERNTGIVINIKKEIEYLLQYVGV